MKFHLSGTSLSGLPVDEYAVTDENGVATFRDVLIGTGYTLEEMDTAIRYVVPDSQSAAVEWNSVTNKSVSNILKKFNVTVTKSDCESGTAQATLRLPVPPTAFIRAISLRIPTTPTRTASSPPAIMSAATTGRFVRSAPPRAICWTAPFMLSVQRRPITPLS